MFELEEALALMRDDLQRVQADAGLKRWLTEQRNVMRRPQRTRAAMGDEFF